MQKIVKPNENIDKITKKEENITENVEIVVRDGHIYISGWCKLLKDSNLLVCDNNCDSCWCG